MAKRKTTDKQFKELSEVIDLEKFKDNVRSNEQFKEILKGIDLETFRNSIRSDFEDFQGSSPHWPRI